MSFFRKRCWAGIAWGLIPLAAWAGVPSTACLCANGGIKLVCSHSGPGARRHAGCEDHSHSSVCGREADHRSHCCGVEAAEPDEVADCCGQGDFGLASESGIHSKSCCRPVLSAPSMAPEATKAPHDSTSAVVAAVSDFASREPAHAHQEAAEFDTGPPLDRTIVFRSLLI